MRPPFRYVKFDYGWNMRFCLTLGLANTAAWIVYCQAVRHPHRHTLYRFLALAYVALLLEVQWLSQFPSIMLICG